MSEENEDLTLKILLVGDSGVGKTNLVYRFTDRKFEKTFISTIGLYLKKSPFFLFFFLHHILS